MNVSIQLSEISDKFSDKTALIFAEQAITFSQLRDLTYRLANGLKALGVGKGAKVAVWLPNSPEYVVSYLAVYTLGAVIVPLDFMLTQEELENIICHCEAKILIAKEKKEVNFQLVKQNSGLEQVVVLEQVEGSHMFNLCITGENNHNFHSVLSDSSYLDFSEKIIEDDPATIFYTSGSTGHPKGVLLNYKHLDGPVKAIEHFLPINNKDVILCSVPLSHSAGWIFLLLSIYFGITLVLQERFLPIEFIKKIEKYSVTLICLVPSMYIAVLGLKEFKKFNLACLKYAVVFGAPSSPVLLKRFHQACPNAHLLNGWGMTETTPPNTLSPLGSDKIESVGKTVPWLDLKIVDDEDKEVLDGQAGELLVRSWLVMQEYYREPELTMSVLKDGWFRTGDLARIDNGGFLYIVGRKKEMVKVAGEIVYSPEVEEVIHRHPCVSEVAVVGVPDKLRGEVPKAFLVLKEGETVSDDELRYFCRQHLAHFKIPHYFEFMRELPKTRTGKIDKQFLKKGHSL